MNLSGLLDHFPGRRVTCLFGSEVSPDDAKQAISALEAEGFEVDTRQQLPDRFIYLEAVRDPSKANGPRNRWGVLR